MGPPNASRFPLRLDSDSPCPRVAQPNAPLFDLRASRAYLEAIEPREPVLLFPSYNVGYRVDTLGTYDPFGPRRITTLLASVGYTGSLPLRELVVAAIGGHAGHTAAEHASALHLRRFALTHLVFPTPTDDAIREYVSPMVKGGRLALRDETLGIDVWAVPHRPWAFFAARAVARERPQDAHQVLLDLMERGDDTVVVEAPEPPPTSPGRIFGVHRGTRSVRVEAESDGPALLVVQDAHWPGWRATIDGEPAEILIADILVRAVRWPPGRHMLEMTYDPPGVRLGLALSAVGAFLVLLLAVLAARARQGDAARRH